MTPASFDADRIRELAAPIVDVTGVPLEAIFGRSHLPRIVNARQALWVALFRDGYGVAEVARLLDRDHTTVISGMKRFMGAAEYRRAIAERYPRRPGLAKAVSHAP